MSWTDATTSSTATFTEESSFAATWTAKSDISFIGNFARFVDADSLSDGAGGVDFNNVFSTENPWIFTTANAISFRPNKENP